MVTSSIWYIHNLFFSPPDFTVTKNGLLLSSEFTNVEALAGYEMLNLTRANGECPASQKD